MVPAFSDRNGAEISRSLLPTVRPPLPQQNKSTGPTTPFEDDSRPEMRQGEPLAAVDVLEELTVIRSPTNWASHYPGDRGGSRPHPDSLSRLAAREFRQAFCGLLGVGGVAGVDDTLVEISDLSVPGLSVGPEVSVEIAGACCPGHPLDGRRSLSLRPRPRPVR